MKPAMNIIIVGPAMSGKSTLAKKLYDAFDADTRKNILLLDEQPVPDELINAPSSTHWILCTQCVAKVPTRTYAAANLIYMATTTAFYHWAVITP